jgi:hypothetical protein
MAIATNTDSAASTGSARVLKAFRGQCRVLPCLFARPQIGVNRRASHALLQINRRTRPARTRGPSLGRFQKYCVRARAHRPIHPGESIFVWKAFLGERVPSRHAHQKRLKPF